MLPNKIVLALVAGLAALFVFCLVDAAPGQELESQQPDAVELEGQLGEAPLELSDTPPPVELNEVETTDSKPKLLSFKQFKHMFHKSYKSIGEEMRRQKLFLARVMRAFSSYFNFKHKKSSSFEGVNQMSDWTTSEFQETHMSADEYYKRIAKIEDNPEVKRELAEFLKIKPGSNIEQPMLGEEADVGARSGQGNWLTNLGKNVWSGAVRLADATDRVVQNTVLKMFYDAGKYRPDLPDEVFIDHRKGNCLNPIRNQGRCGSCYIFSTISLYEWAYCARENSKIKLSEQYLLDCGYLGNLKGCDGGDEFSVSDYISKYGFELLDRYQYKTRVEKCPYGGVDKKERKNKLGFLRIDKPKVTLVMPNKLQEELKLGPFIVAIYPSDTFHHYGGGVDEGKGCGDNRWSLHSVLLVGHGRQDGYEYWLIRNSYSMMWGEMGYYRVRKDSGCLAGLAMGIKIDALKRNATTGEVTPTYEYSVNPSYDWKILGRKFNHKTPPQLPRKKDEL